MFNIEEIIARNTKVLNKLIKQLKIERSLDELIYNFDRFLIHDDINTKRLRLLGIERTGEFTTSEKTDNGGNIISSSQKERKKQVPIYTLKKKDYELLEFEERLFIVDQLNLFITFWKQLKNAAEIELIEKNNVSFIKTQKGLTEVFDI